MRSVRTQEIRGVRKFRHKGRRVKYFEVWELGADDIWFLVGKYTTRAGQKNDTLFLAAMEIEAMTKSNIPSNDRIFPYEGLIGSGDERIVRCNWCMETFRESLIPNEKGIDVCPRCGEVGYLQDVGLVEALQ